MGAALPIASVGMQVFGAIRSFQGAKAEAKAAQNAANYNAQVGENNATLSRQNAAWAAQEGNERTAAAQAESRAKMGAIKANQGASGIDINTGSPLDVRSSAAELGQLNAINIRTNAARKVYGYNTEAQSYDAQAGLNRAQGASAKQAGNIRAQTTLLGGLTEAGSGFNDYMKTRSFGGASDDPITWNEQTPNYGPGF